MCTVASRSRTDVKSVEHRDVFICHLNSWIFLDHPAQAASGRQRTSASVRGAQRRDPSNKGASVSDNDGGSEGDEDEDAEERRRTSTAKELKAKVPPRPQLVTSPFDVLITSARGRIRTLRRSNITYESGVCAQAQRRVLLTPGIASVQDRAASRLASPTSPETRSCSSVSPRQRRRHSPSWA